MGAVGPGEAESVAFIVSTVLGLHMGDVAAAYVGTATRGLLADLEDHAAEPAGPDADGPDAARFEHRQGEA